MLVTLPPGKYSRKIRLRSADKADQRALSDFLIREKNDFIKVFKNLATNLKIILLNYQNNYVECSN